MKESKQGKGQSNRGRRKGQGETGKNAKTGYQQSLIDVTCEGRKATSTQSLCGGDTETALSSPIPKPGAQ